MGATGYPRTTRGGARLRLTRRGRLVVTVLLLLLVAGLAAILSPASRAADPPRSAETAVVRPGDTLWSVAERHRPSQRPFAVIDEIRLLNGLDDYTVHAGQRLILPAKR
ncbi:LysM peptidoglycan-binding domain-containing protein [Plantactinospora sp. CA-294935]|uniref:LysM peptidoglycan-binding domain-containing protein n=1 Tax=Plantactinospora sp. CA-294935 TaxID=3240012 RepID=UPI003D926B81